MVPCQRPRHLHAFRRAGQIGWPGPLHAEYSAVQPIDFSLISAPGEPRPGQPSRWAACVAPHSGPQYFRRKIWPTPDGGRAGQANWWPMTLAATRVDCVRAQSHLLGLDRDDDRRPVECRPPRPHPHPHPAPAPAPDEVRAATRMRLMIGARDVVVLVAGAAAPPLLLARRGPSRASSSCSLGRPFAA